MKKNALISFILLISMLLTFALILTACNGITPCELICVRINNFMAEWENPDYNYEYEGSSELSVTVPHTNVLSVTDCLISPGSSVSFYSDKALKEEITDSNNINLGEANAFAIYIKVTSVQIKRVYKVAVRVEDPNVSIIPDTALSNPGGHVYIPDSNQELIINEKTYKVVRTLEDLENVENDLSANYIMANDIDAGDTAFTTIGLDKVFTGIFNGNNYSVTINRYSNPDKRALFAATLFYSQSDDKYFDSTIENLILKSNGILCATAAFVFDHRGKIKNCVNRADIASDPNGAVNYGAYGIAGGGDLFAGNISKCINYGNITSSKGYACGISYNGHINFCYNAGAVNGRYASGIVGYLRERSVSYCTNLGEIKAEHTGGGIVCEVAFRLYTTISYCTNYGGVAHEGNYTGGTYFGGICGCALIRDPYINDNKNRGAIKAAKKNEGHSIIGNYKNLYKEIQEEIRKTNQF